MKTKPLVSVVIATYNRSKFICETVDSILNQSNQNLELIVVDDGSTDNTEELILKYSNKNIRYVKTDNWGGPARPRNIGINLAKGKYIAFCDDDDIWMPHKLNRQLKYFKNQSVGMVFSMQKQFGAISIFSNYFGIGPLPFKQDTSVEALVNENCIPNSSVIIKKNLLDKIGNFDERKSFVAIEDNDLWIRVSKNAKIAYVPEVLVMHRNHKESIYLNSDKIEKGVEELKLKHGFPNNKYSITYYKNNMIYFY